MCQLIRETKLDLNAVTHNLCGQGHVVGPLELRCEPTHLGLVHLAEPWIVPRCVLIRLSGRLHRPVERTDFRVSRYRTRTDKGREHLTCIVTERVVHSDQVRSTCDTHFLFKLPIGFGLLTHTGHVFWDPPTFFKEFGRCFIMYPKVACTAHRRDFTFNTCQRCAERNLLRELMLEAGRQGVHSWCLARWIHRKYGDLIVVRQLENGSLGTSLPCIVCRKVLDRMAIQWRAHIGPKWVRSTDPDVPSSRPTHRQRQTWKNS